MQTKRREERKEEGKWRAERMVLIAVVSRIECSMMMVTKEAVSKAISIAIEGDLVAIRPLQLY